MEEEADFDIQEWNHKDYQSDSIDCNLFLIRLDSATKLKVLLK